MKKDQFNALNPNQKKVAFNTNASKEAEMSFFFDEYVRTTRLMKLWDFYIEDVIYCYLHKNNKTYVAKSSHFDPSAFSAEDEQMKQWQHFTNPGIVGVPDLLKVK